MALIDVVKYQAQENEFIWKFPSSDLRIGTQVVVNPAQHAFFIKGGKILDEFTIGTHTIKTSNIPLLNKVINLPFGGDSPFQAEVWYVNLIQKLDNNWGTKLPILVEDPKYGIIIPVRAFGQYGFKISDPRKFLETLTGNLHSFSAEKIQEYFKGKIISSLTTLIAKKIVRENISILEISAYLDELSHFCHASISDEFQKFGIEVVNFYFMSVNVPLDDPSVVKLKEAKDLLAKVNITGRELYQLDRSFNVLDHAAKNEGGAVGNLLGAGVGLGLGVGVGNQMSQVSGSLNVQNTSLDPPILYFVVIDNQQQGPFGLDQVQQLIAGSKINSTTLIWKKGLESWQVISNLPETSSLFNHNPPPLPSTF